MELAATNDADQDQRAANVQQKGDWGIGETKRGV
jgi:hypothetical protein